MKNIALLICLAISIFACNEIKTSSEAIKTETSDADKQLTTAETIAHKSGFENWERVSEINFTFNVDRGPSHFERSWSWKPKSDEVQLIQGNDTVIYNRAAMDSLSRRTDASFINDKYWLLAPFNLVWDEGTTFSEKQNVIAPISGDTLNQLTVVYGNDGGYTPGDAYDFFFGNDFVVKEWNFRKGNDSLPTMTNTWEDYKEFNGLKIATMHKDSIGDFRLYFTNISVKQP